MEIQYAKEWNGRVVAKCSREVAKRMKNNGGFWRMMAGSAEEVAAVVERDLGHAGFRMVEVPMSEFKVS
jgi:hypothetical protein